MPTRELGSVERAFCLTAEEARINVVLVLRLAPGPSLPDLARAFARLQDRYPLLRARIVPRGRRRFFECDGASHPAGLDAIERRNEEVWREVVERELMRGFDAARGPLIRCAYLQGGEANGAAEVVLTVHHSALDATFGAVAVGDLLTLAAGVEEVGESPDPPPAVLGGCPDERLPVSWRSGISRRARLARYLARQTLDELSYRRRAGSGRPRPPAGPGRCRILTMALEEEEARRLARSCRRRRLTVASVLQAAMLRALARRGGRTAGAPLRYFAFPDMRPFLEPPPPADLAGCFAATMRFTIRPRGDDLWGLARQVQDQALRAFRGGEKFAAWLASPLAMRIVFASPRERMATTALNYAGVVELDGTPGSSELRELHAFTSNFSQGPEYTAQARWFRGRLVWDIVYLEEDMSTETAASIAAEIRALLAASTAGEG